MLSFATQHSYYSDHICGIVRVGHVSATGIDDTSELCKCMGTIRTVLVSYTYVQTDKFDRHQALASSPELRLVVSWKKLYEYK